jgi:hypothetical protein
MTTESHAEQVNAVPTQPPAPPEQGAAPAATPPEAKPPADEPTEAGVMRRLGDVMQKPSVGASVTGAVMLAVASTFGVIEALVAAGAAYGAYRLLRKKRS